MVGTGFPGGHGSSAGSGFLSCFGQFIKNPVKKIDATVSSEWHLFVQVVSVPTEEAMRWSRGRGRGKGEEGEAEGERQSGGGMVASSKIAKALLPHPSGDASHVSTLRLTQSLKSRNTRPMQSQ